MPRARQLTVWVEDRPGELGRVASAFGAKKVNIRAFMAPVVGGRSALRFVVDKPAAAKKICASNGWETTEEDVIEVTLSDRPGSLGGIASKLAAAGVNIECAYVGSARSAQKAKVYFAVSDLKAGLKALR